MTSNEREKPETTRLPAHESQECKQGFLTIVTLDGVFLKLCLQPGACKVDKSPQLLQNENLDKKKKKVDQLSKQSLGYLRGFQTMRQKTGRANDNKHHCSVQQKQQQQVISESVCFVYLEKSGHELQPGVCVALRLFAGLCTPTVLVPRDRIPHFHPHRKNNSLYYSLIESPMARKKICPPPTLIHLTVDIKVEQIQPLRMKPNHCISLVSAQIMIHPCKGQQGAAPAEHLHSTSVFSLSARSVKN